MADQLSNNEEYWRAMSQHGNPIYRAAGIQNLHRIEREREMAVRNSQFQQSMGQRAAEAQARRDAAATTHQDAMRMADQKQRESAAHSQDVLTDRRIQGLLAAAQVETDPAKRTAIMDQYYALSGTNVPQAGAAPAGGANPAVQRAVQKAGYQTVPQQAPQQTNPNASGRFSPGAPASQGGLVGGGQGGGGQGGGGEPSYPPGTYMTPGGVPSIGGSPAIPSNRLIQHGQIVGGPPGYDLNVNTGEWIPSNTEGTINGRPAHQVAAESAMKRGVSPEAPEAMPAYNKLKDTMERFPGATVDTTRKYPGMASTPSAATPAFSDLAGGELQYPKAPDAYRGVGAGSSWGPPTAPQAGERSPVANVPEQIPTDATGDRQWPSGGASSGMHSGEWLADQLKDVTSAISFNPAGHVGENAQANQPQPPASVLPQMTAEQTAAIEARRQAEEEARRRAAEAAARGQ